MSEPHSRTAAWRAQHAAAFAASLGRLLRRPFSSGLSLGVMAIALALPLALGWSLLQMDQFASRVQASRAIHVFLMPDAGVAQAERLADGLRADPAVAAVRVKTPEQGLREFRASSELANAVSLLGENPLPAVLVVEPSADDERALVARLQGLPGVEFVQHDGVWQRRLQAWLGFGSRLLILLGAVFALGAVLAVANNIRLDIATRETEIAVLQQLGASDAYIRRPFLYAGGLLGLSAGILALAILAAAAAYIQPSLLDLIGSYGSGFRFAPIPLWLPAAVIAGAVLLGLCGAYFAVAHYLRLTRPVDL